jgi:hypothetical protein
VVSSGGCDNDLKWQRLYNMPFFVGGLRYTFLSTLFFLILAKKKQKQNK